MMNTFYKRKARKAARLLLIVMLLNIATPAITYALTSGPSQPEVQAFEPASTTEMVDLFTGDFTYNIPLFELPGPNGGYPFNLAYHAGIGMDQEASWVGLGWSLNPGAINRQMRGLPDEFKGDSVMTKMSMKPSQTVGTGAGIGVEVFGALNVGADMSVFYNTYKGVGLEFGNSLSFSKSVGGAATAGISLGFSVNSQEGVNVNPSLSVGGRHESMNKQGVSASGSIFVGAGYNSRVGLHHVAAGVSGSANANNGYGVNRLKNSVKRFGENLSITSEISLASPGFIPSVGRPMTNHNVDMSFELGASWWGLYPNVTFRGFYNRQELTNKGKNIYTPSYGYMHYQHAEQENDLLDFNREKDGIVREENPNLPIPSLTYDIYSATGQGYSAMYRAMRSDVGIVHDPFEKSISKSLSLGGDVGPTLLHVGVNSGVNHAEGTSGKWKMNNKVEQAYSFRSKENENAYEPWYFKAHGEPTITPSERLDIIGGDDAVRVDIKIPEVNPSAEKTLEKSDHDNWQRPVEDNGNFNRERTPRNNVIQPITNAQLLKTNGEEAVDLFKINYYKSSGDLIKYSRNQPGHHVAGFTALTPEGSRYVYGLPAYNLHHEEISFSVRETSNAMVNVNPAQQDGEPNYNYQGTDKYFNKKVIPAYAHSYLLTSIVGQDYVDVTGDGLTEDDLGYWVKFTYHQTADKNSPYKWRAPFHKANYFSGFNATKSDDRGSFMYGEKEIWYLKRVETKSHIAEFKINDREDARGALYSLQNVGGLGKTLSKLDEIVLYTRHAGKEVPLKKVKFEYSYDLCKGLPNASSGSGKLTLKKLWFEYGNNTRGALNPYRFDYHEDNPNENPDYNMQAYDRWGHFKPADQSDPFKNQEYPYVDQGDPKSDHDLRAGVWSLKEIRLPSGGEILVDYESDDYAYVQNRQAMQMMELVSPTGMPSNQPFVITNDPKIRFKLNNPIPPSQITDEEAVVRQYVEDDRDMLYFKLKVNLRSPSEDQFDWLTTYASIDRSKPMGLEAGTSGDYEYGYFHLKPEKNKNYHPLLLRAWQHLKINQPDLASMVGKVNIDENEGSLVRVLKSIGSVIPQVRQMFTGFFDYANNRDWGKEWEAGKCWVRLLNPEKRKFGGGHRVKQITFKDHWEEDEEGVYGQVYEYNTAEKGNNTPISSGVAAYEPIIGGDENPIRYAKKFSRSIPLASDNTLFFEYPVNEGYYPGARVGYSKVRVMSLASAVASGRPVNHAKREGGFSLFPDSETYKFGTTGMTEHEFYTAKEYPVITDETTKSDIPYKLWVPLLVFGTLTAKKLTSSQGYSIITNDMHGKLKSVNHYGQSETGTFEKDPFSWTKYHYMNKGKALKRDKIIHELDNVFADDGEGTIRKAIAEDRNDPDVQLYYMGQETEFFLDMREHSDKSYFGGANVNVDVVIIPIAFITVPVPVPTVWPNAGKDEKTLRTVVTNKVIFKSGIIEKVEAYNEGSHIVTKHLKWDKLTGKPVLTKVNNNFDDPIYSLEIPAHTKYAGMGAAYDNIGYTCNVNGLSSVEGRDNYYSISLSNSSKDILFQGDELVINDNTGNVAGKAIYIGKVNDSYRLYSEDNLADGDYEAMVYRSGKRNILTVNAGIINALSDPTQVDGNKTYSVDILNDQ